MNPSSSAFEARGARISVGDVVAIESLDYVSRGDRVVLYGDVTALIAAISAVPLASDDVDALGDEASEARVSAGSLLVGGASVRDGEHFAVVGTAPLDPPLPPAWTAADYVVWSLRLGGVSKAAARPMALAALQRVGMSAAAGRKIGVLARPERRVLLLAHAVAREPRALVLEQPLADLEGEAAAFVGAAMAAVTEGRQTLLSVRRLDVGTVEGSVVRGASDLLILRAGALVVGESPARVLAGARLYGLTVRSNVEELRRELATGGLELVGGPLQFSIALPDGVTTTDILRAAQRSRAAVVELLPLW